MPGIPSFLVDLGWWAIIIFLFLVVFTRTQATYWAARWLRRGAVALARDPAGHPRLARVSRVLTGPKIARGEEYLNRWGTIAIPLSFLTLGIQTLVNAAAGYTRMRWDLYTLAMLPGCVLWVTAYAIIGASAVQLWLLSPWALAGAVIGAVGVAVVAVRLRRNAGSSAHTPR